MPRATLEVETEEALDEVLHPREVAEDPNLARNPDRMMVPAKATEVPRDTRVAVVPRAALTRKVTRAVATTVATDPVKDQALNPDLAKDLDRMIIPVETASCRRTMTSTVDIPAEEMEEVTAAAMEGPRATKAVAVVP